MILKKGSVGESVKEIQKLLGLTVDGIFGPNTEKVVKEFQKDNNLKVDGKVGSKTLLELMSLTTNNYNFIDNDGKLCDLGDYVTNDGLTIHKRYLDSNQFVSDQGKTKKEYIFIHHTAGRANPFKTIKNWNLDNRGRIATQYCIGGISLNGDSKNDGVVVESFPDEYFGWHLGKIGSKKMHRNSIGIELNNWGWLTKKDDKYFNYVGLEVPIEQVEDLGFNYRGYRYFHKYTNNQLISLGKLLHHLSDKHEIDLFKGLNELLIVNGEDKAFNFIKDAYKGKIKGLLSHTNVRRDKTDCSPQNGLIKLLKNL